MRFAGDGEAVLTNFVFPEPSSCRIELYASGDGSAGGSVRRQPVS
ncbi:GH32 C-terminal domain-containing protein [Cohnella cellulosilytica]|uniref:GH32 C-terminal domain-containing protein n=1 Tax=Cohnella cellulosilytica TaxID=986710 RepID=A0ABW2FDI1_9BACL